jgi:hypothetical protein
MDSEKITHYLPYVAGGVIVILLLKKFMLPAAVNANPAAGLIQGQIAAASIGAQSQAQMAAIQAQSDVGMANATAANNGALGNQAQQVGGSMAQIIAAQSYLAASAINSVGAQNQVALEAAANVAISAYKELPNDLIAQANQINALNTQFSTYANATGQMTADYLAQAPITLNAVTAAGTGTAAAAAQASQAAVAANASNSGAMWSTVGTVATYALMAL